MPFLYSSRRPDPNPDGAGPLQPLRMEGDLANPADGEHGLRPLSSEIETTDLIVAGDETATDEGRARARAEQLLGAGRRLDALLLLRRFLEETGESVSIRWLLAEALEGLGDLEEAGDEWSRVIAADPNPIPALVRRGALYARTGQIGAAETDLRRAIRDRPSYGPAYVQLGLTLIRRGVYREAIGFLREGLSHDPDSPDAEYHLGEALYAQGDLPEALGMLQRAALRRPTDPRTYKLMGRLFDRLGRTDEAMTMHRKAREVVSP